MDGRTGRARAAPAEGQELVARPHPQHRQRALIGVDGQAEEPLVERDRARLIGHEDREVVVVAQPQQALGRRRLRGLEAHVPEHPLAAAVGAVLQLHDDAVGVAEVQLGGALGGPAELRPAHADADLPRPRGLRRRDAVLAQDAHEAVGVEAVDREAVVADAGVGARAAADGQELRPVAHPKDDGIGLPGRDGHAEQPLVPLERPRRVRDADGHVVEGGDGNGRRALRQRPRGQRRRAEGAHERAPGHAARLTRGQRPLKIGLHDEILDPSRSKTNQPWTMAFSYSITCRPATAGRTRAGRSRAPPAAPSPRSGRRARPRSSG